MKKFDPQDLKKLYVPQPSSHKGQNGKLMIIGGSRLFHGASLWALKVASRIVDMVFYAGTSENNKLTESLKKDLYDFIAIEREKIEDYVDEADAVLIGPGLPREEGREEHEEKTKELTERLLRKYPRKKWIIDAGSLTEIDPEILKELNGNVVITPHPKEFSELFKLSAENLKNEEIVQKMAREYNCVILLKGEGDTVCSMDECVETEGGNPGMTKGGTGDVLAGLVAALSCKNDLFLAAKTASYFNKKAGEELYEKAGPYFNASDLCDKIPVTMKKLLF